MLRQTFRAGAHSSLCFELGRCRLISHFTVGLRAKGKADRVVVDADDALIAALKVKAEHPDATIIYVRRHEPPRRHAPPGARPRHRSPLSPQTFL